MDVITDEERERGLAVLHRAMELEKTGHSERTLWGKLLAACVFAPDHVNCLIQDYSNYVAQGFPKSDLMEYRAMVLMKTEHHRHLLSALLEGGCFMNGRLNQEAAMTLFDNEERLASVLRVSSSLSDQLLKEIIEKAGSLLVESPEQEESIEKVTNLEKFFSLTKEAPHCLARAIDEGCQGLLIQDESSLEQSLHDSFHTFISLYSLINGMLASGEQRRQQLELHHRREGKALRQFRIFDWIHHHSFLFMWDTLLHTGTKILVKAKLLEKHEAKKLVHVSVKIARRLFTTLGHILENGMEAVLDLEHLPERFMNVQNLAGHYLCTIIACCFGQNEDSLRDEEIQKELLSLAKDNCCYEAIFDLLYKYTDNGFQLLQLMIHWDPAHRKSVRNSLTYIVFTKWMESGDKKDLEHLLRGSSTLDSELVMFLKDHDKTDLVVFILIRMGHISEARRTLQMKGKKLTPEDQSLLFVLSSADPMRDEVETKSAYLQFRLESIVNEFNLDNKSHISPESVLVQLRSVLEEESNIRSQQLKVMNSMLDIFCCKELEFIEEYNEEWRTLWRFLGLSIKGLEIPSVSPGDTGELEYPYEDFKLICKACEEMKLPLEEKEVILEQILSVFGSDQTTHSSILNTLANILDLSLE
eukprot:g6100.t1